MQTNIRLILMFLHLLSRNELPNRHRIKYVCYLSFHLYSRIGDIQECTIGDNRLHVAESFCQYFLQFISFYVILVKHRNNIRGLHSAFSLFRYPLRLYTI